MYIQGANLTLKKAQQFILSNILGTKANKEWRRIVLKSEYVLRTIMNIFESEEELLLKKEAQNIDYEGATFQFKHHAYRTRMAKLTPKKKGYFVAVWEKAINGTNQAYRYDDSPDKLIVSVIDGEKCGQFIFPKQILLSKGILKNDKQKGKMAFRVYPSWVTNLNATATKTQLWQSDYFIDISLGFDVKKMKEMYF